MEEGSVFRVPEEPGDTEEKALETENATNNVSLADSYKIWVYANYDIDPSIPLRDRPGPGDIFFSFIQQQGNVSYQGQPFLKQREQVQLLKSLYNVSSDLISNHRCALRKVICFPLNGQI
jgi:hypothetical protein